MDRNPASTSSTASADKVSTHRVLLVDDDRKFCRLVAEYLEPFGFQVSAVHTGPDGVSSATGAAPGGTRWAAVILDLMLPGMDGFEVLRRVREKSDVPVLMLTARGEETDRIVGLEIGADDYVPKTSSTRELLARLRALVRRSQRLVTGVATTEAGSASGGGDIIAGPVRVNPDTRRAFVSDQLVSLTPVEFDLLVVLARACGRVRSRDQLLDEIRDREYEVFDRSIDVHVSALRRKLGDDPRRPRLIHTIRTVGYMLDPDRSDLPPGGEAGAP